MWMGGTSSAQENLDGFIQHRLQDLSLHLAIAPQHPGIPDENDFGRWFCLSFSQDCWP